MDKPKAVTAAAHKIARLIYTMLTMAQEYTDQSQDYYEERHRERVLRALSQRAAKLGMQMVLNSNRSPARAAIRRDSTTEPPPSGPLGIWHLGGDLYVVKPSPRAKWLRRP